MALLKLLLLIALAFYVVRAARNLWRAVQEEGRGQGRVPPPSDEPIRTFYRDTRTTHPAETSWKGTAAGRSRTSADIEDARWRDL